MSHLEDKKIKELELIANKLRQHVIESVAHAGSGHQGGPLGLADIMTALYFHTLKHDPKNPEWEGRDPLLMSCGHYVPIRYAAMAEAGYMPVEELKTLRQLGSRLQGHPERVMFPALENTSGPLGEGLGQAAGMALAYKMDKRPNHVFCICSDGEQEAGIIWEAVLFAAANKLDNLIAVLDRNNIQIDGDTEDIMPLEPLADKYRAFNWHVIEINGNDMSEVIKGLEEAKTIRQKPILVLAHTTPGKDVSYMENDYRWHSRPFKDDQAEIAMNELKAIEKHLREELKAL